MSAERNGPRSPSDWERKPAAPGRSSDAKTDQPSSTDGAADFPYGSSTVAEGDRSSAGGKGTSRLVNAITYGTAGAAGGGAAGLLVGWGGVGIAAAGGAVGFPVVVPVAVGTAAGVGAVAAARALSGPVARASSAVRRKVGEGAPEPAEEDLEDKSRENEGTAVMDPGVVGGLEHGDGRGTAAAGTVVVGGAAAVVAGASLIRKLRRRVFKNARPGHIRVPPNARTSLYEKQQGICNGCDNHYQPKDMALDHIVPRARGGTNALENLQLLCHHCNSVKGVRSWDRFRRAQQRYPPDTGGSRPSNDPAGNGGPRTQP